MTTDSGIASGSSSVHPPAPGTPVPFLRRSRIQKRHQLIPSIDSPRPWPRSICGDGRAADVSQRLESLNHTDRVVEQIHQAGNNRLEIPPAKIPER
jgi:hypothetical protein